MVSECQCTVNQLEPSGKLTDEIRTFELWRPYNSKTLINPDRRHPINPSQNARVLVALVALIEGQFCRQIRAQPWFSFITHQTGLCRFGVLVKTAGRGKKTDNQRQSSAFPCMNLPEKLALYQLQSNALCPRIFGANLSFWTEVSYCVSIFSSAEYQTKAAQSFEESCSICNTSGKCPPRTTK